MTPLMQKKIVSVGSFYVFPFLDECHRYENHCHVAKHQLIINNVFQSLKLLLLMQEC